MPYLQLLAQDWAKDAACRSDDRPERWHPGPDTPRADVRAAKRMCASCPVKDSCLADAMDRHEPYGIWGGQDHRERRRQYSKPLAV